jgi:hypothetical protein
VRKLRASGYTVGSKAAIAFGSGLLGFAGTGFDPCSCCGVGAEAKAVTPSSIATAVAAEAIVASVEFATFVTFGAITATSCSLENLRTAASSWIHSTESVAAADASFLTTFPTELGTPVGSRR